jgi:hypothetical protein
MVGILRRMELRRSKRDVMRFTIVDPQGSVSFVGDSFFLPPLVAACATNPTTLGELLTAADMIDKRIREYVLCGLAVFDEHNTRENYRSIQHQIRLQEGEEGPVLRVVDEVTRDESLRPTRTGLVIFNLNARRIVQIKNLFMEIQRVGEAHLHNGQHYSRRTVKYELPDCWQLVP